MQILSPKGDIIKKPKPDECDLEIKTAFETDFDRNRRLPYDFDSRLRVGFQLILANEID